MRLKNFCYCLSLGFGARFIGFVDVVLGILALVYQRDQWISSRNVGEELSIFFSCNLMRIVLQLFFLECGLALMCHFPFVLVKFRFYHTGKYNRKTIFPWLLLNRAILGILYFLVIFALINVLQNGNRKKSEELMALSLPIFALVLRSYSWFVVYSYFEELKENNKINKAAAFLKKSQVNKEPETLKEDIKTNCTISPA